MTAATTRQDRPFPVTVHPYPSAVKNSCAYELPGAPDAENAIIFIGGLWDGPHTVPFVRTVADKLRRTPSLGYSVFEIRTRSAFSGFAFSSLTQDVEDISALVTYLRGVGKKRIVLFGHSTGSQDCVEYANYTRHSNEPVDGFILQGSVSDRQGTFCVESPPTAEEVEAATSTAKQMISEGKGNDPMPMDRIRNVHPEPISAYRIHSLQARGGDDDFFSTDLDPQVTKAVWGRFTKPVLIMFSGQDVYVPPSVDKEALVKSWTALNNHISPLSGLIPGASHAVWLYDAQLWLADRVATFLETV